MSDSTPKATIILAVEVNIETDHGTDPNNGFEPPYDYLAVRNIRCKGVEFSGGRQDMIQGLVEWTDDTNVDPDALLPSAVLNALEPVEEQ